MTDTEPCREFALDVVSAYNARAIRHSGRADVCATSFWAIHPLITMWLRMRRPSRSWRPCPIAPSQ